MASSSKFPTTRRRRRYPTPTPTPTPTPPPPPPSSIPKSFLYDVFLSFRGIDTRNNFTCHLYDRLVEAGIHTFMDDPELRKGGDLSTELMGAIEKSRIYIVVFSKNYAASRWCLDELVNIRIQCENNRHRVLIPVFFGVEPSEVRHQKGSFEEAFRNHEANSIHHLNLLKGWREALRHAANYSESRLITLIRSELEHSFRDGGRSITLSLLGLSESRLITLIVKEVLLIVNPKKLFVAKYPVGLDSRLNHVYSLLSLESNREVQFIGIWGMGGSGKTVIAKALYDKILQSFDSSCFLANVRQDLQQMNGLLHLQEKLISRLLMRENVKIDIVDQGIEMIKERLCRKKVLIVIDDTDELSQVDALAGHRDWFGHGSVIIITTRDKHLLKQVQVDVRYETKELNSEESLELFSWHSFKTRSPQESYAAITIKIIAYCQGLPLALEVLGSYLGGRPAQEWNSVFKRIQKFPPHEIQKILKISYDGLDDDEQRGIFLDIACFFTGMDIDYVTEILNGCDFSTEIGIGILKDRCLLTIDFNNELKMHDLLRDMGREIIRQQCPEEPGERSRLWSHKDAENVLRRNQGTKAIKGVSLVSPTEINLNTTNFANMIYLRLLEMEKVNLHGGFEYLSKEIKWIRWQGCSLEHLPSSFEMPDLVVLDMQHSRMKTVWHNLDFIVPSKLKILNLSHSNYLTSTPDFTKIPNLVTLILEGCTSLLQIDPSIGCLHSLTVLNLKGCQKITNIPSEVCRLRLLGNLNLSGCSNLKELPDNLGCIEFLRELYADETAIKKLPSSMRNLRNLTRLSLRGCTKISAQANMSSIVGFSCLGQWPFNHLRGLNLRDCNLSDEDIPESIGWCSKLLELDLAGNSLTKLPNSFRRLIILESLWLDNWNILQSITNLPPNLQALVAKNIP